MKNRSLFAAAALLLSIAMADLSLAGPIPREESSGQRRSEARLGTAAANPKRITEIHASKADSFLQDADVSGKLSTEELLKLIRE